MKLVKLSLVAALAVGSMSVLEAKPLEEAIKNVDVSGVLRYRFDPASWTHDASRASNFGGYNEDNNRPHRFRAFLTTKLDAGDGFKLVGQLMYNNDRNGGWGRTTYNSSNQATFDPGLTTTKNSIVLKQAYLQYDLADAGVSVLFGKQQLNTIWTADFTGMAAKVLFTPTKGLTIAAFGVDSFEGNANDGDAANIDRYDAYNKNMYGAAVLANFAGLDAQVWGAYWDKVATLYAANLKYTLGFGSGNNAGIKVTYLGNSVDSDFKNTTTAGNADNGNLVDGRLFGKFAGLDVKVGGIFYGKKDGMTINTLEDISGPDLNIGREMFYTEGARLVEAIGRNTFGYVGIGYTLPANVRIGVQGVFGQNVIDTGATIPLTLIHTGKKANSAKLSELKDTRYEAVGEISWAVNKSLSFETFYSYLGSTTKDAKVVNGNAENLKEVKHTVRLQALYKF